MEKTAVVICNYNKKDFVLGCIESVFRSEGADVDLIGVGNASTDGSAGALRAQYGNRLTLLVNKINTGGSGGFNLGMKTVMDKGSYRYLIQLDNDVTVKKDTINELLKYAEDHPEVGVCGAAIFRMDNPEITQEMGANISFEEFTNKPLYMQAKLGALPPAVECDYVPIGASVIRTEALKKAGLMESRYFIYWDDMEFCWRMRKAGYRIHAISSAIVYHNMSSPKYDTTYSVYYFFRNKINCFAGHVNDSEFALLPDIITKRLYRIMICNKDNIPVTATYMHALDDALNGVMGKAADYKIVPLQDNKKWHSLVKGKANILIRFDPAFIVLEKLVSELRMLCNAKITVVSGGASFSNVSFDSNVVIAERDDSADCDLEIYVCYHALDFPYGAISFTEGRTLIIDNYGNAVADCGDVTAYLRYEENYSVFKAMMYQYIKDKLSVVRENYIAEVRETGEFQTNSDNGDTTAVNPPTGA
jgi:GT2 family glycosyltransferase